MRKREGQTPYLAFGVVFGTTIGLLTDNFALWIAVGIALGAALSTESDKSEDETVRDEDKRA